MPVRLVTASPFWMLVPLHQLEASQESGEPVVVKESVVALGDVRGPAGVAERLTEMPPTAVTVVDPEPEAVTFTLFFTVIENDLMPVVVHVTAREPVISVAAIAPPVKVQPAGANEEAVTAVASVEAQETVNGT